MEEEVEGRDSKEDLVSPESPLLRRSKREKPNRLAHSYYDDLKDVPQQEILSPNLKATDNDFNHLDVLSNFDSNSKFGENASLIKDIRLAASAAAEEEFNKVYMCHLCDFKTAYANSLMNHQAVHSDYRPWACTACEYAAKRKQDLKKHLQTVHGMMVESPMLKPVMPSSPPGPKGMILPAVVDGTKEHFAESLNLKRSSPEKDYSVSQPSSSCQGLSSAKRIKEEASHSLVLTPHSSERGLDRQNSIPGGELDSPDDNLPISFPTSSSASSIKHLDKPRNSVSPTSLPKYLPGREEGEIVFNSAHPNYSWHLNRRDKFIDSTVNNNIPRDWSSHRIKKENDIQSHSHPLSLFDSKEASNHRHLPINSNYKMQSMSRRDRENSLNHSFSLSDDETHISDDHGGTDRIITSSSLVGQGRSTQTPSGFLCEHCDILFYQRAMYVMHIGLHAPDNPWCCAVCGNTFTEKYSFTSHFINQH